MTFSLNEVEATAKKAARGAGHSWGMAEEAGRATRWLCAHGFDGCAALAALLLKTDGTDQSENAPGAISGAWRAARGPLCPLLAGAALSDFANTLAQGEIRMKSVFFPMLLIPFAANASRQLGTGLFLEWEDVAITTNGANVSVKAGAGALMAESAGFVRICPSDTLVRPVSGPERASPEGSDWQTLNLFTGRTYAPATEESRLLGAGADLTDND